MIFKRDIKIYLTLVLFLKKKILFIKKRSNHFSNPKEMLKLHVTAMLKLEDIKRKNLNKFI